MDKNKVGLTIGALMGLWHLTWGVLVLLGFAQFILDWIYWLHFLNNPFTVEPFDVVRTVMLVVVTSIIGYVVGWVFVYVWEMMRGSKRK